MAMSNDDRLRVGRLIQSQRERKYGTKKAAYQAAQVNAATWDKAESGGPVRDDLYRQIIRTLWPHTEGDWTQIEAVGGAGQDPSGYVTSVGPKVESGISNEDLLREILRSRAEYDQLRAELRETRVEVRSLSLRVEGLEQPGT